MKKYSLKELIENGHHISETPENIHCWVDLPFTENQRDSSNFEPLEAAILKRLASKYCVCKEKKGQKASYSIRRVFSSQRTLIFAFP